MEENNEKKGLQIEIDPQTAEGTYANLALVGHSMSEFVVDFVRVLPNMPKAKVKSRVVLAPEQAKGLMMTLQAQVAQFEKQFGEIRPPMVGAQKEGDTVPFPIKFGPGEA